MLTRGTAWSSSGSVLSACVLQSGHHTRIISIIFLKQLCEKTSGSHPVCSPECQTKQWMGSVSVSPEVPVWGLWCCQSTCGLTLSQTCWWFSLFWCFFFKAVEDAFVPVIKFKFDGIEVSGLHQQAHTFCSVSVFSVRQWDFKGSFPPAGTVCI